MVYGIKNNMQTSIQTSEKTMFIEVILPLSLPKTYTYKVPPHLQENIQVGKRVEVQFGKKKNYSAIIQSISHDNLPNSVLSNINKNDLKSGFTPKNIISVLDEYPIVNPIQLKHWQWISEYYLCTKGEVLNAALPAGLKLSSETKIIFNSQHTVDLASLNEMEFFVAQALESQHVLTINDVAEILEQKDVFQVIKSLQNKELIYLEEELVEKYKPKSARYIKLHDNYKNEKKLRVLFDQLEKAPKQLELLMTFIHINNTQYGFKEYACFKEINKAELLKHSKTSTATLDALVSKEVFEEVTKEIGRFVDEKSIEKKDFVLSSSQQSAYNKIVELFQEKPVVLLFGVTGSGKTEIYIRLIEKTLKEGKQVLYLLPEIALTTQIIDRLKRFFSSNIGVYHSKFSNNERVEIWNSVLNKKYSIILGARSACYLPFSDLGLVIIDEEHENTFKQFEPAPRYHARDTAIFLAHLHNAKTVLGSATPSFESYNNTHTGKYGLVQLQERYDGAQMPHITITDIKEDRLKKKMKSHYTSVLLSHLNEALANKEQAILFQNRRGYAPYFECNTCGWVPKCNNCDVSLTYHKQIHKLKCHYCGFSYKPVNTCMICGKNNIEPKGFGTEKIEDELSIFFPDARIARLDLDTTRSKYGYHQILSDFDNGNIDILVGTQMVTKGLDFDNVSVVGILSSDSLINFPDFRSYERAYQLMTQVSGRSGRKNKQGKVIIQSLQPENPIIKYVLNNDYEGLYNSQLAEREQFKYPPFYRLIKLVLKHKELETLNPQAEKLKNILKEKFGNRILGPEFPPVMRVRNQYLKNILLKIEKNVSVSKAKQMLVDCLSKFNEDKECRSINVIIDVDPM